MTKQIFINRMSFIFSLLLFSTSHAQITWEKYESNPVFPLGPPGAWDDSISVATSIIVQNDTIKTWYEGNRGFGYAFSLDSIAWNKDPRNPILHPGDDGAWDDDDIFMPSVIYHNDIYKMWYGGIDKDFLLIQGGYATSPDVTFIDNGGQVHTPKRFILGQNYPNPFNPVTMINYQLPVMSR